MGKCDEASVEVNMGDSASPMKPDNFTFTVPPEAPVFEPTPEEFQDPLAYINKIRPIAEKSGICKIKPPEHWQPPFAVDVDRLRFTPRIQRLNELEAITRVKLNFLDQIINFWELQGSILKIPIVERKPLDLYALHKIVKEAGGFEVCSTERKWSKIARRMAFPQGKGIGSILKNHYERILYPYDVFKSNGAIGDSKETKIEIKTESPDKGRRSVTKGAPKSAATPPRAAATPPPPRRPRPPAADPEGAEGSQSEGALVGGEVYKTPVKEEKESGETRRSPRENKWMSMGAGCGARVTRSTRLREHRMSNMTVSVTPAARTDDDPLAKYMCRVCGRGDVEEQMLLCDGCDDSYHTFCLAPPLDHVPKGDWRCPVCLAEEVSKPTEAFGFEQASREYTLQQFGEMADQFKSDYFNMPVHMVPTSTVEKEFWRVVSSIDEDVTVEYGADLHSMDHGSGFPTKSSAHLYPGEQQYAESGWNLNNLPVLEGSVLCHIDADISGMKVPWLYVGMCFATFCWHNEDHWSYSINYLHWGEPKTWYGVPGTKAEQFEAAMKSEAPELFQLQPDLLHQLVTIMNPNILMKAGVPVYRTDQHAGEFVITFPRAYHAGFNQGYNFAEAVNFTPADWLKMGRECITHYSTLRRYCVFSHDELVCKMALAPEKLTLQVALAAHRDMRPLLHEERRLRKALLDSGVTKAERAIFELLADDERQCHLCKTTCFLSCVECPCSDKRACLRHYRDLCRCPPHQLVLKYRYTLDELPTMLERLKARSAEFHGWAQSVTAALDPDTPKTQNLDGLRNLLNQATSLKISKTDLVRALETAIADAEKCVSVIQQLDLNKMRTRTRQHDPKYRLTVEELTLFAEEIDQLACSLPEGSAVKEVLRQTEEFERRANEVLSHELRDTDLNMLRNLEETVEMGSQLCIVLDHLPPLQARLAQVRWLEDAKTGGKHSRGLKHTPDKLKQLLEAARELPDAPILHIVVANLHKTLAELEEWDSRATALLEASSESVGVIAEGGVKGPQGLVEAEGLLALAEELDGEPDKVDALAQAAHQARDWLNKVEEMQSKDLYPYYHTLEALVKKGAAIPLALYEKERLNAALESAQKWKAGAAEMFLKKNWNHSLMEALSPRTESPPSPRRRRPAASTTAAAAAEFLAHFTEKATPAEIVQAFKHAEANELAMIKELRARNSQVDPRTAPPGTTFCTCGRKQYGNMTQCELCNMWMHASCIASNKEPQDSSSEGEQEDATSQRQYLCPDCCRTKRPRLDKILSLLVWLQKLPVRLAEGEALQCVTERAMAWQDHARQAIHHHREQASREKSDKLNAELKKANGRTHEAHMSQRSAASMEHAYSATPRPLVVPNSPANMGHMQLQQLEELMIEGFLLEVTLEEQSAIRAAVAAARGPSSAPRAAARPPRRHVTHNPPNKPAKRPRPGSSSSGKGATSVKRGSTTSTTNYLNRKQSSSGSSLMMRKHYMARQQRRARSERGRKQRMGEMRARAAAAAATASSSSSSSADDDDDCATPDCLRPSGKEVDWVQCDGGCEGWFHMHCVGLKKDTLRPDDDYVCGACTKRRRENDK